MEGGRDRGNRGGPPRGGCETVFQRKGPLLGEEEGRGVKFRHRSFLPGGLGPQPGR